MIWVSIVIVGLIVVFLMRKNYKADNVIKEVSQYGDNQFVRQNLFIVDAFISFGIAIITLILAF